MERHEKDDAHCIMEGTAALFACLVESLKEIDPTIQSRFLDNVDKAYRKFKDDTDGPVLLQMTLLAWTSEMLTGWSRVTGEGKPFLQDLT
jgi:hypothetical protein